MNFKNPLRVIFTVIFILILASTNFAHTQVISGTVFNDSNQNMKLDANESGIEGVLVSNQIEIVKTDNKGCYTLPIKDESIIFVIKPAGYDPPRHKYNLPYFYYIHDPDGSPPLKYKGVDPTGQLPNRIDFPLFQKEKEDTFEVIVFSDPQPRSEKELGYIRDDVVSELIGSEATCGIILGDIMYDDLSLNEKHTAIFGQIGIPLYHVPGNHDMNYDAQDDHYALETFKRHYGPPYYGFQYGKVHFIAIDDVEYQGNNQTRKYIGKIGNNQLQWIENYLEFIPSDHLIVLNMHIPLYTFAGPDSSINVIDRDKLLSLLQNRNHLLALIGHMHTIEHQYLGTEQGWRGSKPLHQIICGAVSGCWWNGPADVRGIPIADQRDGVPNGYHIFRFEGNKFTEIYKSAQMDRNYQIRISQPIGKVNRETLKETEIIVNVFNGNDKTKVTCQIDNITPFLLTRKIMKDPYFEEIYSKYTDLYYSWVQPENSNHIWIGRFPSDLELGVHRIIIQAINQYGDELKSASLIEIE